MSCSPNWLLSCFLSPTETMTMFENVTRALTKQLNPRGDLTPLESLIDFKRFHPFCLVLRKRKSTLFWGARYVRTDYTLLDVLEPGSSPSGQRRLWGWVLRDGGLAPAYGRGSEAPSAQRWLVSCSPEFSRRRRKKHRWLSPASFLFSLLQT